MGKDDDDREAILKRRKRFIAVALGGLAAGAIGCSDPDPMPCLNIAPPDAGEMMDSATMQDADMDDATMPADSMTPQDAAGRDAAPMACLDIAPVDAGEGDAST